MQKVRQKEMDIFLNFLLTNLLLYVLCLVLTVNCLLQAAAMESTESIQHSDILQLIQSPAVKSVIWPNLNGLQQKKWPLSAKPLPKLNFREKLMRKLKISKTQVFDFATQLRLGLESEKLFHTKYPNLTRLDGKCGDFKLPNGRILELKTDFHNDSKKFFFERWSNIRYKKPGGPWQSMILNVDLFVYVFGDGREYWFETDRLVQFLEPIFHRYEWKEITNKYFVAYGKTVPIADLKAILRGVPECLKS